LRRTETPSPAGFDRAEAIDASVAEGDPRQHEGELLDLVGMGDFLAPEVHRHGGVDEAAVAIGEWADHDLKMIAEAEAMARAEHHDDSAEILHRARVLAAA
jgi:hypothetical protein